MRYFRLVAGGVLTLEWIAQKANKMCFTVCFDTQEQYFLVPYDVNNLRVAARHNLAHLILYLKLPPSTYL